MDGDFPAAPDEFIIPKDQDEVEISFQVPADDLFDSGPKLLKIGSSDGAQELEVDISNTDPFPVISLNSTNASEGQNAVLTISLDRGSRVPLSFNFELQHGTTSNGDFESSIATVKFSAGETSQSINIALNADSDCEADETFSVTVTPPLGLGSAQESGVVKTFTIEDDSTPVYSISSLSISEGSSGSIELSSNVVCAFDRTITVSTFNDTANAGADYTSINNQDYIIAAGLGQVSILVETLDDSLNEVDETFFIFVTMAGLELASSSGTITIKDNDPPPVLTFTGNSSTYDEDSGTVQVHYTLTPVSGRPVAATLTYLGTATSGSDYISPGTSITIPAGTISGSVAISIMNDTIHEPTENLTITLSHLSGAEPGPILSHMLTIDDNDSAPKVSISAGPTTSEGANATFTMTLSQASGFLTTVDFTTSDGTGVATTDYIAASETITFAPGQTSKTFTVETVDNETVCQPDRTFVVNIDNPTNATLGAETSSMATIIDNDGPAVEVDDVAVMEGNTATLTANLQMVCSIAASFNWTTENDTASSGIDFVAKNGTLNFAIGETTKTFTINTLDDIIDQGSRTFKVTYSNGSNIVLPLSPTVVTISDNDTAPTISWSIGSQTVTESQGSFIATVSLSHVTNRTVTANVTASGTAVNNVDYTLTSPTVSVAPGQISASYTVNILRDNAAHDGKTLKLTLTSVTDEPIGAISDLDLTILDAPYQGPTMLSTPDSNNLAYLSGINSSLVLASGVPNSDSGNILSQNSSNSPKVNDFFWSGDSTKVVFIGNVERFSGFDIFSINPNGGSRTRLNPSGWTSSRNVLKAQSVPGTTRIIYQFDQTMEGLFDLASVNLDGSSELSIVSGLNSGTESVSDFAVSPDGSRVVYTADTAIPGRVEIFSVTPTGAGTQKLNLSLSPGQSVDRFKISPDSSKVAFVVTSGVESNKTDILYVSPIAGGSSMPLSLNMPSRQVGDFSFSPDSSKVGFTHNMSSTSIFDLYIVNANGSSRMKINPTYTVGGGVSSFRFTPDSAKIGFLADAINTGEFDLFIGPTNGILCCTKLNASLAIGGKIESFDFTENSASVVYLGKQDSSATSELYAVSTAGSGRTKLNLTPATGGNIMEFIILPNGNRVLYLGDQDSQGQSEVYSVNLSATSRIKLNPTLSNGRKVDAIFALPDSTQVLFRMNNEDILTYQWYSIGPLGGAMTKIFNPE